MGNSIIELTKRVNIVCTTIVERDGSFLVVEENKPDIKGLWNFLSGKLELGETPIEAAEREAKEESGGMDIQITDLVEVGYGKWADGEGLSIRFVFWGVAMSDEQTDFADDVVRAEWKTGAELEEMVNQGKMRNEYTVYLVEKAIEGRHLPLETINAFGSEATAAWVKKEFGG